MGTGSFSQIGMTVMNGSDPASDGVWEREQEFDYTDQMSLPAWAWEFLRRNPVYRKIWESVRSDFSAVGIERQTIVIEAQKGAQPLAQWGMLYADDPMRNSRNSFVVWHPDHTSRILRLTAVPASLDENGFRLQDIACPSLLVRGQGPLQHLVFRDGQRALQLAVDGETVLRPVRFAAAHPAQSGAGRHQLPLQRCFTDLRASSRLVPSHFHGTYMASRLKRVLRALDGSLAGVPQRRIAVMLFGEERVDAEWCAAGRPLRDKVRRTIHRGHALMEGGYREFLR